jgi:hypothetical protein
VVTVGRSSHFSIRESDLSVRAKNVLQVIADRLYPGYDWITWRDITKRWLLAVPGCGALTAREILDYGVAHASPAQAERLQCEIDGVLCPACGQRLPRPLRKLTEDVLTMTSIAGQLAEIRELRSAVGTANCYRDVGFCEGCERVRKLEKELLNFCVRAA